MLSRISIINTILQFSKAALYLSLFTLQQVAWAAAVPNTLFTLNGETSATEFGRGAALLGDVNWDGYGDFIIGTNDYQGTAGVYSGRARVYSGKDATVLFDHFGTEANSSFGRSVSAVGDLNHDGYSDYAIAAPFEDYNGLSNSGVVRVYSGKDGTVLNKNGVPFIFSINKVSANFGYSMAVAGDIDHDGQDDLIIGMPGYVVTGTSNYGAAQILSGNDGHLIMQLNSANGIERFGTAVDGVGDVDADGYADLLIGAYQNSTISSDAGAAYLFSGRTGTRLQTMHGTGGAGNYFGQAVSGLGDINHDGHADFVVGAPGDETGLSGQGNRGRAYVYDGSALPTTNQGVCSRQNNCATTNSCCPLLYMFSGDPSSTNGGGASMGFAVDGAGDVDGDSFNDILVGQTFHYQSPPLGGFIDPGNVKVYSGQTGVLLFDKQSSIHADHFGMVVAGGADINGDCLADWLGVGEVNSAVANARTGRVEVFSATSGFAAGCFPSGPPPSGNGSGTGSANNGSNNGGGVDSGDDNSILNAVDNSAVSAGGGCGLMLGQPAVNPLAIGLLLLLTMLALVAFKERA